MKSFNIGIYFDDARRPIDIYYQVNAYSFDNACKYIRETFFDNEIIKSICSKHLKFKEL